MAVTAQALQEIRRKNDWRDWSSNVSWKQILTMPTWRSAAECSTVGQLRPEKLDRRWLKDGRVGQQAMMLMQSGDADEPRQQMTDTCFVNQNPNLTYRNLRFCERQPGVSDITDTKTNERTKGRTGMDGQTVRPSVRLLDEVLHFGMYNTCL